MTFTVYGDIQIDGKSARVEIKGVDDALRKAAQGADGFKFSGETLGKDVLPKMRKETQFAAGSVATLGAQFNDIGVMFAAGQNPLQLAIQQGTQITQVFGNAGAAQRVAMLKQAFASVVSPVNLLTIGVIAGAAALGQWGIRALSAGEDTDVLAEKIEKVTERITTLKGEVRALELGVDADELILIDQIRAKLEDIAELRATEDKSSQRGALNARRAAEQAEEELTSLTDQLAKLRALKVEKDKLATRPDEEARARAEIVQMQAEANVNRLIAQYGAESAAATRARLQAERDAYVATLATRNVSEQYKDDLLAAWDNAKGIAGVDFAGNIILAANEAERLAAALNRRALDRDSDGLREQRLLYGQGRVAAETLIRNSDPLFGGTLGHVLPPERPKPGAARAARAAEAERDAVDALIRSLELQRDLLRETDPVQKEMIRNRETLASATDTQRASIEQLIAARITEEAATERAAENAQAFRDIAWEGLDGVLFRSNSAAEAVSNLANMLARASAQSLFLGEGPLAGLFGTRETGGLLGLIGSAVFGGTAAPVIGAPRKDGGMIFGRGGPRDDMVLTPSSPGEFYVNAQATAQNRALLEHINAGGLVPGPGFGGQALPVAVPVPQGGPAAPGRVVISLAPSELFETRVLEASRGVFVEGMRDYRAQGLPRDVQRISQDPGRIG